MGFSGLMSAFLAFSHAAAPHSDPERCRAAVSEAQALLAAVDADPDSYENVEETPGHAKKAGERINQLNRILKRRDIDPTDRATAEALKADLQNALDLAGRPRRP